MMYTASFQGSQQSRTGLPMWFKKQFKTLLCFDIIRNTLRSNSPFNLGLLIATSYHIKNLIWTKSVYRFMKEVVFEPCLLSLLLVCCYQQIKNQTDKQIKNAFDKTLIKCHWRQSMYRALHMTRRIAKSYLF